MLIKSKRIIKSLNNIEKSIHAFKVVFKDSCNGFCISLSACSWTFSLLRLLCPSVCVIMKKYMFLVLQLGSHKQSKFRFVYGNSFFHIFCIKCGFFDVFYRMKGYLYSKLINQNYHKLKY